MPLWKIILEGQTAFDVQGVNLRETVERIAINSGINGYVRNRKGTKLVEVVCKCESEQDVEMFKNAIIRGVSENPLVKCGNIEIRGPKEYNDPVIKDDEPNGFEIKREDELTEMVWALQNAGKALLIQNELRQKQQFRALDAEMDAFQEVLNKIEKKNNIYKEQFALIAIEGFLREPPSKCDSNLIARLYQLYRYAKTINNMIETGGDKDMPLDYMRQTLKEIEDASKGVFK